MWATLIPLPPCSRPGNLANLKGPVLGTAGADMLASRVVASTVYRWKVEEEEDPVCVWWLS